MVRRSFRRAGWCSLAVVLAAAACGSEQEAALDTVADAPTFEEWVASVPQEPGSGLYIVDWDVPVASQEELRPYYDALYTNRGALTVNTANAVDTVWNGTEKHALTYCVSHAFGDRHESVVQAMAEATGSWMAAGDVRFVHVAAEDANCTDRNENVLFDVNPTDGQLYVARAFIPGIERKMRNVLIDSQAFALDDIDGFSLLGVLTHELGHALGFRHEHVHASIFSMPFSAWLGCSLEKLIDKNYRPVTDYDAASVMHYPQCGGTGDMSITALDIEGVQAIYGAPTAEQ